jgi:hypothetical protein
MNKNLKRALIITGVLIGTGVIGYVVYKGLIKKEPLFGKGRVDAEAKYSRRVKFFKQR